MPITKKVAKGNSAPLTAGWFMGFTLIYFNPMDGILERGPVKRVSEALSTNGMGKVHVLADTARTAQDAATALDIEVGRIASSLIFKLPDGAPILVITSGRHRVDTDLVSRTLGATHLERADANFVKELSGFSVGGVSPLGWLTTINHIYIDEALNDYDVIWAAGGHPHAVFPTTFDELKRVTAATPIAVE
jgi:prolyl-tRNA editing enzyme YbaK/EbsC (Cys-tRNA(Pro) deacylase)